VRSEVAGAASPLHSGIRGYGAEDPFIEGPCPGATLALFDDRMASAAVERAPFSGHKSTLGALLERNALHGSFSSLSMWGGGNSAFVLNKKIYHAIARSPTKNEKNDEVFVHANRIC
jgi:hypothetical protein